MTANRVPPELLDLAQLDNEHVLQRLKSSPEGLSETDAEDRLQSYGQNVIAHEARKGIVVQILQRLRNPLNLLLLTLASVSLVMGDEEAAVIIFMMVVLSVSLAFLQERRSNKAAEALRAMVHTTATVLRKVPADEPPSAGGLNRYTSAAPPGSAMKEIPIHLLVPGDVIHLSAGDMVPADLRLLSAKELFVNEAPLTGEAMPVEKFAGKASDVMKDPLQVPNLCFMGTSVVIGTATAVVALTGTRAYFGGLADIIAGERSLTSFDQGISKLCPFGNAA